MTIKQLALFAIMFYVIHAQADSKPPYSSAGSAPWYQRLTQVKDYFATRPHAVAAATHEYIEQQAQSYKEILLAKSADNQLVTQMAYDIYKEVQRCADGNSQRLSHDQIDQLIAGAIVGYAERYVMSQMLLMGFDYATSQHIAASIRNNMTATGVISVHSIHTILENQVLLPLDQYIAQHRHNVRR